MPSDLTVYVKMNYQSVTSFEYAYIDAANFMGSTATYTIGYAIPLPLEVILSGDLDNQTGNIQWLCYNEQGVKAYELSRRASSDVSSTTVSVVSETGMGRYLHNDDLSEMPEGWYYYTLYSIHEDGTRKNEGTIALHVTAKLAKSIVVTPNPTASNAVLKLVNYSQDTEGMVEICSSGGAVLQQIHFTGNSVPLEMNRYAPGMYIINLILNGERMAIRLAVAQ
jgi:hypothetical protein